jgi:hypothetical protein
VEEVERDVEGNYEENRPVESNGTHRPTERSAKRLGQLLPHGKYVWQTESDRQLGAQQVEVLYMARLEETRTQKEEPDAVRSSRKTGICIQPNAQRRMGNSTNALAFTNTIKNQSLDE